MKIHMNGKILIIVAIIGAIATAGAIVSFGTNENETVHNNESRFTETDEISSMLKKINDDRILNEQSENPYYPQEREWISSGPFKIDRSQYYLGEKLFVNMEQIDHNTKGEMVFSKILNDTHDYRYKIIKFDGSKYQQNYYFGFTLNEARGLCDKDQLVGNWKVTFEGIDTEIIKFKVLDRVMPAYERQYEPVC